MIYEQLARPFLVLAPMDDVTDTVFRQVVADIAPPDLFFTEFVNVDGLCSPGRSRLLAKLRFSPKETPLIAQLWGKSSANFTVVADQIASGQLAAELGLPKGVNFAGVDLNMGCPQKTIVNNGTCSALMNNRELAKDIIEATKKGLAGRLPLSVKTRTGYNQPDLSWIEFLLQFELAALTIHGRTKKQMSKMPADWSFIAQARELRDKLAPKTLIIGNGDVLSRQQGINLAQEFQLDGVMIGRGIFHDPYLFADDEQWQKKSPAEKVNLYARHVKLFQSTWRAGERPIQTLNKFCKLYINGFSGAKELREQLMSALTSDELLGMLERSLRQPTLAYRAHVPPQSPELFAQPRLGH